MPPTDSFRSGAQPWGDGGAGTAALDDSTSTTAAGVPGSITFLAGDPGKGPATSVGIDPQHISTAPDGTMFAASNDLIFQVNLDGSATTVEPRTESVRGAPAFTSVAGVTEPCDTGCDGALGDAPHPP